MRQFRALMTSVTVLAVSLIAGVAFAQEATPEPTETELSGVVVGVDTENETVDILQADGTIVTVKLSEGDYDHPITTLLAAYFGTDNLAEWGVALETLETDDGVIVGLEETTDADGNPVWVATAQAEDGTTTEITISDADEAAEIEAALAVTTVDLTVTDDGSGTLTLPDISEEIEAYHEAGLGYGELVKIYAIAEESQEACEAEAAEAAESGETTETTEAVEPAETEEPCGVTVDELAQLLLSGADMGYLFETYGKPALLGVGHVRQALGAGIGGESEGEKVAVCHNGKTIMVDASAVPAHVAHGDSVGGCG